MYNDMNVGEIAATENKACLNYAHHYKVRPITVNLAGVRATPLGVEGWAKVGDPPIGGRPTAKTAAAAVKPKPMPSAREQKATRRGRGESAGDGLGELISVGDEEEGENEETDDA